MKTVFMYSGQGAQYYQMGKELYDKEPTFRASLDRCSQIVSPLIGNSLVDVIYGSPKATPFERTLYTHPANVAFCYSLTQTLYAKGVRPDLLLGYSLGEYVCAMVSEALSLEEGLEKIVEQAKIIEETTANASMMAILDSPSLMQRQANLFQDCSLAGHNFANHFVITAKLDRLKIIEKALFDQEITAQILPISHGFHSPIIDPAQARCSQLIEGTRTPKLPCWSGMMTQPIEHYSGPYIWKVVRNKVRFLETIHNMERQGPFLYIDVGPAGTLSTFVKYILGPQSASKTFVSANQFGRDIVTLDRLLKAIG